MWAAGGLLALGVLVWLGVPALVQTQLPQRLGAALGRPVSIGRVEFEPWNLALTLTDVTVGAAPAAVPAPGASAASAPPPAPLLQIARIRVDADIASLWQRAPVIEALQIDAPRLRLARLAPGRYDVDDLIARWLQPPPAAADKPAEPLRFAAYNLQVRDARIVFDDRPAHRVHVVDALQLGVPFVSNLPAQVDVAVQPRLSFKLNGTPFDTGWQATPFAARPRGDTTIVVDDLDLEPYFGYWPAGLPLRPTRGRLTADLKLQFVAASAAPGALPSLALKGSIGLRDVAAVDSAGQALLAWQRLSLGLADVQPLAHRLAFGKLAIDALTLHVARDAQGRLNLAPAAAPAGAASRTAASDAGTAPAGGTPWQASLDALELTAAQIVWNDAAVTPAAALRLDALTLGARALRWPLAAPVVLHAAATLRPAAPAAPAALGTLRLEGPVSDRSARLALQVAGLQLGAFAPYLAPVLVPRLVGALTGAAELDWSSAPAAPRLTLRAAQATLADVRLGGDAAAEPPLPPALALEGAALDGLDLDLSAHRVSLDRLRLTRPELRVARDRTGHVDAQDWIVPGGPPAEPPWRVAVQTFAIDAGRLDVADAAAGPVGAPLRFALTDMNLALQRIDSGGAGGGAPMPLQLDARLAVLAPGSDPGATAVGQKTAPGGVVAWRGDIGLAPLLARGRLRIERFPVHRFLRYAGAELPVRLIRADAGYDGSVRFEPLEAGGADLALAGDVQLGDVRIDSVPGTPAASADGNDGGDGSDELLSWKSLRLQGMALQRRGNAAPRVDVGAAAFDGFYARLVVTEAGRINLQDVTAPRGAAAAVLVAALPPTASAAPAARAASAVADGFAVAAAPAASSALFASAASGASALPTASAASAPQPASAAAPALDLRLGPTELTHGRIDFSDHFVRPHYSARLTELNGRIGPFRSGVRDMATLELRGKAAGTAQLEIRGALNPTVSPPALDIRAKATDIELPPLSPYAAKYAGYAIERGKLSMDVTYRIDPNGRLQASNQLTLKQLTFGERVASPDATRLPVLLAVALLQDRNGVIDIDLPVSGSLDDPQFSVAGLIGHAIGNLLAKAITAPFSLFAGRGGASELSEVAFEPGTTVPTAAGRAVIDKIGQALADRPALTLTVTGRADPASERDAYVAAAFDALLFAERRRDDGEPVELPGAPGAPLGTLDAAERKQALERLYNRTKLPDKPRNLIGLAKSLPAAEMEARLKTNLDVSEEMMRELAAERASVVRDTLIAKGLPSERLFIAALKLRDAAEAGAAWTPHARMSLAAR